MVWENPNGERNECLDTLVYSLAAIDHKIQALGAQPYRKLREYRAKQKELNTKVEESIKTKAEQQPVQKEKQKSKPKKKGLSALNNRNWF